MMIQKDKAKELIIQFDINIFQNYSKDIFSDEAKLCATLTVNEIIKYIKETESKKFQGSLIDWWFKVKQEIKKL